MGEYENQYDGANDDLKPGQADESVADMEGAYFICLLILARLRDVIKAGAYPPGISEDELESIDVVLTIAIDLVREVAAAWGAKVDG